MRCLLIGHSFVNEIQTVIQIFYPLEKYTPTDSISKSGMTVVSSYKDETYGASVYMDGALIRERFEVSGINSDKNAKISLAAVLFRTLKEIEPVETPWGMMTGIRPTKKIYELLQSNTREETERLMRETYYVNDDKLKLLFDVVETQKKMPLYTGGTSLYIGIPFCPTRCLYCSFASDTYNGKKSKPYLKALFKELEFLAGFAKNLETIYIGGGTPTSLDTDELESLLFEINRLFPIKAVREFTVEAGRPDTLNQRKLRIFKDYGVSRISINPQTLIEKTLERIGRGHTAGDFFDAYKLAREIGHDNINADIILGLPGEDADDVKYTLEGLAALEPDSLTVHTLAVKRASKLKEKLDEHSFTQMNEIKRMLELADKESRRMQMRPYYLYRQKNMTGNLENTGYAKRGKECLYNVIIMEETQTILAAGAGAVTKTVDAATSRIERVFNVKNIDEYISRIDEMIERKRGLLL